MKRKQKINTLDNTQLLLLNQYSSIIQSCDSLFSTHLLSSPVIEWCPFVESIFDVLLNSQNNNTIVFKGVEEPLQDLLGFYDFSFSKIKIKNEVFIEWIIYDQSKMYLKRQKSQQIHHDSAIYHEHRQNN